jgi:hypothetical protein
VLLLVLSVDSVACAVATVITTGDDTIVSVLTTRRDCAAACDVC